jgi:hypothetical protein
MYIFKKPPKILFFGRKHVKIVLGKKRKKKHWERGQGSELKVIFFGAEFFQIFKLKDLRRIFLVLKEDFPYFLRTNSLFFHKTFVKF